MNFKSLSAVLTLTFAAATTTLAHATPVTGSIAIGASANTQVQVNSSSISLTGTADVTGAPVTGTTLGMIADCSACVTFPTSPFYFNTTSGNAISSGVLFSISENGGAKTATISLDNIVNANYSTFAGQSSVMIQGYGTLTETVGKTTYDPTMGTIILSASSGGNTSVSFEATSATIAATPEPSSLMLLGTGVLGAAGMVRRRFSKVNA